MGLPVEVNNLMLGSLGGYTVGRSLRFRSSASAYLNRTPSSAGNSQKFTFSAWVKRGILSSSSNYRVFQATDSVSGAYEGFEFASDTWSVRYHNGSFVTVSTAAVLRDPSAWYHLVGSIDTTDATASNRIKLYINGVQQATSGTMPAQNYSFPINAAVAHAIASYPTGGEYFDGYLAEVNFIDGQALTPSSFGAYDTNGVWQPKKYTGTYGTNGFYLPFSNAQTSSYGGSFNGSSQYLTIASNAAFNIFGGDMTAEAWIYPTSLSGRTEHLFAFVQDASNRESVYFNGTTLTFWTSSSGGGSGARITSTAVNQNEWNHVAVVKSGSTFTLYVNGVSQGTSTTTVYSTSNQLLRIGTYDGSNPADNFTGTISNVRVIKGTAAYTSNFIPSSAPLAAITNTQLLTLQDSTIIDNSANAFTITNTGSITTSVQYPFIANITADYSGNVNNWNANNIGMIQSSTTYDSMIDSPTNSASSSNYAVLNPLTIRGATGTLTNGNLSAAASSSSSPADTSMYATLALPSNGLIYLEALYTVTAGSGNDTRIGVSTVGDTGSYVQAGSTTGYWSYDYKNGTANAQGSNTSYTAASTGQTVMFAIDVANGKIWAGANGTWYNSGNPASGTGAVLTSVSTSAVYLQTTLNGWVNRCSLDFNFGQRPFSYTPPTGYKALNTYNLPAPSIANGAQYMNTVLWSGNSTANRNITGVGFNPDFVWLKCRNSTQHHHFVDVVRGTGTSVMRTLFSSSTNAEDTDRSGTYTRYGNINALITDGFTVNSGTDPTYPYDQVNATGLTYTAWNWKAGGTGVTNNSGTITSTVSASPSSGFSIVTYTETSGSYTVGHGLGVTPSMIILKERNAVGNWIAWHNYWTAPTKNGLYLNATNAAFTTGANWLNSTSSTTFGITAGQVTGGSANIVAYCFSAVRDYSAFGSYNGTGSSDGPMIYTGFRPRFIMWKNASFGSQWILFDTSRSTYNISNGYLEPNTFDTENTASVPNGVLDILSNGFKLRTAGIDYNDSSYTYVYAAFAEHPFQASRAR